MEEKITNSTNKLEYDFIQKLIKRRKEMGISQSELADSCHFPQSTISRYEIMKVSPSLSTLTKICEILDVKLEFCEIKQSKKHLNLVTDMYGCPNRCRHCWLGKLPNNVMAEGSDDLIVNLFKPYFKNITFYSWLREPDFCPDYESRWKKDNELSTIKPERFELASFYRLVRDENYVKFLKEVGTKKVQLSFFGLKDLTDKYVGRKGAFEELLNASDILKANGIEPRWQIFINEENKVEIVKLIEIAKEKEIKEIFIHEGSCEGNNLDLYDIRINKSNIPKEVIPYYLDYDKILSEKECIKLLENDESFYVPKFEKDIVLNITSDYSVYFNYTNISSKWVIGNIFKDDIGSLVKKILNNDTEATRIAKSVPIKELVRRYGNTESERVFSLGDYKMYLLNKCLLDL